MVSLIKSNPPPSQGIKENRSLIRANEESMRLD
jgi:hypothetical protein